MCFVIRSLTMDYSTISMHDSCPQKFAYRSLNSLTNEADSKALKMGKLIHSGIEQLNVKLPKSDEQNLLEEIDYLCSADGLPTKADEQSFAGILHKLASEGFDMSAEGNERYSLKHLLRLILAYYQVQYPNPAVRATHSERKHVMHLGYTRSGIAVNYSGTLDGLQIGPQIKVIERKTSSYLDDFPQLVKFSGQATGYVALAQDLCERTDINTIEFDVISTTGYGGAPGSKYSVPSRWLLNTNPSKLFLNCTTTRTAEQIAEWREGVLYKAERIAQDTIRGQFSRADRPEVCHAFRSPCPYADLCTSPASVRGTLIANTMQTQIWESFQINTPLPPKQKLVV